MTEKRFIPIFDGTDKRVVGAKDNGKIISFMNMFDLLNELSEENERLKSKNSGLQSELQIFKEDTIHSNLQINKLVDENEELKKEVKQLKNKIKTYNSTHELLKETIDRLRNNE